MRRAGRTLIMAVVLTACGAAAGGWLGSQRTNEHDAESVILISPLLGNPFTPEATGDNLVNLTTEAELVASDPVAQLVSDKMAGHPAAANLLSGISVRVPANTQLLAISVRHPDRAEAVRRAQAFATTFLAYREARRDSAVFDRSARIKELVDERASALKGVEEALAKGGDNPANAPALRQQALDLTSQISELRTQLAGIESASSDPGQLIKRAAPRSSWLADSGMLGVVAGGLVGLLLALAIGSMRDRVRDRIVAPDDLSALDVPVFGPVGEDAEDYRRVRTSLLGAVPRRPIVVLTGPATPGSEPSRISDGLATALGVAGHELIVVDACGDPAGAHDLAGLSDVILDPSGLDEALVPTAPHVASLGCGRASAVLDDLVASPELDVLFQELRKRADVVLVVPGWVGSSRAGSLARFADAVLVEVVEGESRLTQVQEVVERVPHGGKFAAAVYIRTRPKRRKGWFPGLAGTAA